MEVTRCYLCEEPIIAGEDFYTVILGTSKSEDEVEQPKVMGSYCTGCGPQKPE